MEEVIKFVLVTLATYRLAHMIADERGPADVFHKLRTAVYKRWPDKAYTISKPEWVASVTTGTYPPTQPSWQFDGITCIDCMSFWLAWLTALAIPFTGIDYIIHALAVSAVCVLINHNSK